VLGLVPAVAHAEDAPPGSAEAVAVQVPGVISVSHTQATAGSGDASATANVLELGGAVPDSHLGGSQQGEGTNTGNIVDTGATPLGQVQVAPWEATAHNGADQRSATGKAAVARVSVIDASTAHLDVLQSQSTATHTSTKSTGASSSDGAVLTLGDALRIVLLHSEANSEGTGSSYLLGINDTTIGTSDQANGACAINADPLLTLLCLTASGGNGLAAASVADLGIGGGALTGTAFGAKASSAAAPAAPATPATPDAPAPAETPSDQSAAPSASLSPEAALGSTSARSLPRTGGDVGREVAAGFALLALGAAVSLLGRARRVLPVRG
jgi:hypothetical protein